MTRTVTACENCRYFKALWKKGDTYQQRYTSGPATEAVRHDSMGQCRRHPPVFSQSSEHSDGWPHINAAEWCGEFLSLAGDGFDNPNHPDTF